jgi:hypothetical protein
MEAELTALDITTVEAEWLREIESILCVSKLVGIVGIIWAGPIDFLN